MLFSFAVNADIYNWGQDKVHWYNKPLAENSHPANWSIAGFLFILGLKKKKEREKNPKENTTNNSILTLNT